MCEVMDHVKELHERCPMPEGATHVDVMYNSCVSWEKHKENKRYFRRASGCWSGGEPIEAVHTVPPIPPEFLMDVWLEREGSQLCDAD